MILSEEKIRQEIGQPSKAKEIHRALVQQERIKFHVDTNVEVIESVPYGQFKNFIKSLLPDDKYQTMVNLIKFPIETNKVTDEIWVKLSKIFDGRNPAFNYQFKNAEDRKDWESYRMHVLREPSVWMQDAWEFFKTEFNGIVVVDMPENPDPSDSKAQPYFYFVPIDSVISYSNNPQTKSMDWVIFRSGDRIIVIDESSYRTYTTQGDNLVKLSDEPHTVGYCPAKFFWNESLSLSNPDVKRSPISKALGDLDWFFFWSLAKKQFDLSGAFPIYSGYEQECDFTNSKGDTCQHGYLVGNDGHYVTDEFGNVKACPICHGKKNLAGPGSYVEVPVPAGDDKDLRNPVQILQVDKNSLQYCVEEKNRLHKKIVDSCVGTDASILNETSLADKQVDATYESQDTVLNRVKQGFEEIQEWVDQTCCILRYGDSFLGLSISYGTEFYTLTPEVILNRYTKSKAAGASDSELDSLSRQFLDTTYRHDPIALQRMNILADLEPYRHMTKNEVLDMYKEGLVPDNIMRLKLDFSGFIRKFERENENILEFGSQIPYVDKINTIYKTLLSYAETQIPSGDE